LERTAGLELQTARAATIAETNGRASIFLGSVSAGLVAIAFADQTSRTALYAFALVLFPVLFFLGLVTFERALQASIDDTAYMLRINRVRRFRVDPVCRTPWLCRHRSASPRRAHQFPRLISRSASISSSLSAMIRFSRAFSRSRSLSRLASSAFMPPNWFRHRW
jgi:hypothetical protein